MVYNYFRKRSDCSINFVSTVTVLAGEYSVAGVFNNFFYMK